MQLLQKLTEQADRQQEVAELIGLIKQAKPFFDQRGDDPNAWLYRGLSSKDIPTALAEVRAPRSDRRPLDTSPDLHALLDAKLAEDFGFRYRSGATFVTGDHNFATDYGSLCIVLPLGQFKYVYAKTAKDAYDFFNAEDLKNTILATDSVSPEDKDVVRDLQIDSPRTNREAMRIINQHPSLLKIRDRWFEAGYAGCGYTSPDNIIEGIASGHEIMLQCPQIAIIPFRTATHPDILHAVGSQLKFRFDFGMEKYPTTGQLINLMLPHIFK